MPRVWRIIKHKYAVHAFDGEGARRHGSRWTSQGIRVVHGSQSLSLALLEVLVHLRFSAPLATYSVCTVDFSEDLVEEVARKDLRKNWRDYPGPAMLKALGDDWYRSQSSALLRVPSVIVVHEFNYLINPSHPDFSRLKRSKPAPMDIDLRLFGG